MNSREREGSKIYHSSWILPILDFVNDAKLNYDTTKVWKRVWILGVKVWKRVWKMEYFGLKLGQDLGNRAAHLYQKFRGVPPPPPGPEEQKQSRVSLDIDNFLSLLFLAHTAQT